VRFPQLGVLTSVLRGRGLRRLAVAFGAYATAEAAVWVAILVYAYQQGGVVEAGLVAFVQLVPAALLAPLAALAGDRFHRDAFLAWGHVLQALAAAAAALVIAADVQRFWVYAASAAVTAALTLTRPALGALLPAVTRSPEELVAANAASGALENLGGLVGPLAAAGLLLWAGPAAVFAAAAVLLAWAAYGVVGLGLERRVTAPPARDERGPLRERLLAGVELVQRNGDMGLLVACMAAPFVLLGALEVLLVAVATELLGRGEHVAGYLNAAFGLGGLVGASAAVLLVGRRRLVAALCLGGLLMSAPILGLPATAGLTLALALLLLSGIGQSFADVVGITLLQRASPDRFRARVFGVLEGLVAASLALGALLVSGVSAALGARGALVAFGLLVPAVLALALRRLLAIDDAAVGPPAEVLASLRADPIFAPLAAPGIERLAARAAVVEVPVGEAVMREGEVGDRYYRVLAGALEVRIDGAFVRLLGPGDGFGEIALLRAIPRTATVTATSPARMVALDRATFLETVTGHPQSHARAATTASRLLAS